jgi:hypothetical protein
LLKAVTIGDRRLYIYPTVKGLVKEGKEVRRAFEKVRPDAVGVSLSDRELAEVRLAISGEVEEPEDDYVPESVRASHLRPKDDADESDGDDGVEVPSGIVSEEDVHAALDEPFHPDLVAADAATRGDQIYISDTDMTYSKKLAAFGDVELPPPSFREAVLAGDGADIEVAMIDLTDDEYTQVFVDHVTYWMLVRHSRLVKRMRKGLRAKTPTDLIIEWDRRIRALKGFEVLERERERKMATALAELLDRHMSVLAVIDLPRVDGTLETLAALMQAPDMKVREG